MKDKLTLGEKIKFFRTQKKLSQSDLEIEGNISFGTISRIESGQINPTKETLAKIIAALDIKPNQAASLFDINFNDNLARIVKISKKLSSSLDIDEILQASVNEITYELDLLGAVIFLVKDDRIYSQTFTQTWYSKIILNLIPAPMKELSMSIKENPHNLLIKTIKEKKPKYSLYARDFAAPIISAELTDILQKIAGHKCGICFPIISEDKAIGAILFSKNYIDDFSSEKKILEAYVEHVGAVLGNAQKYQNLKEKIKQLKK